MAWRLDPKARGATRSPLHAIMAEAGEAVEADWDRMGFVMSPRDRWQTPDNMESELNRALADEGIVCRVDEDFGVRVLVDTHHAKFRSDVGSLEVLLLTNPDLSVTVDRFGVDGAVWPCPVERYWRANASWERSRERTERDKGRKVEPDLGSLFRSLRMTGGRTT